MLKNKCNIFKVISVFGNIDDATEKVCNMTQSTSIKPVPDLLAT